MKTLKHLLRRGVPSHPLNQLDREKLTTYYPVDGYGAIADRMAEEIIKRGGRIHCGARVERVILKEKTSQVFYTQEGKEKTLHGSLIVSTLPLPLLIKSIEPSPPEKVLDAAKRLDYRPLLFLGIVTERQNILPCSYLYVLDRPYNRITEMNKFSPETSPEGENILGIEIPCALGDNSWNATKEALFDFCIESLEKDTGLRRKDVKKLLLAKAAFAYPIYRVDYRENLNLVLDYLHSLGSLKTLGRSGEFMYMDADKCMRRAFDLVKRHLSRETLHSGGAQDDAHHWIDYWDQDQFWAQSRIWALNARLFLQKAASFLEISSADKVLDIGCGPGFVAELLAPRVNRYAGLDTSESLLRKAQERCALLSNVSFERLPQNYTQLEVSEKFSLFLCISVIQYYASLEEVLALVQSVRNVAAPGARLLLADIPQPRNFPETLWDFACSLAQSFREGYLPDYLDTIRRLFFSEYRKFSKKTPLLEIPVQKLAEKISQCGLKTILIRSNVSLCANRPSLLIQF